MAAQVECYRCGVYVLHGLAMCPDCALELAERIQQLEDELRAIKADPFRLIREMGAHDVQEFYTEEAGHE